MNDIFVQKISLIRKDVEPQDFDLSFLREMIYIEPMDLSGPRLILRMYDPGRYLTDFLAIQKKEMLELTLEDIWGESADPIKVRFIIMTMPTNGTMVEFNCFESSVEKLKRPISKAMVFSKKPVETIIKQLLPGMKYNIAQFPTMNDYHIPPGVRPSKVLRQLAYELAAAIWICRGTVYCKPFKTLRAQKPAMTFFHNNPTETNQILQHSKPSGKALLDDVVNRNYMGWDISKGIIETITAKGKPIETVSQTTALDNLLTIPEPLIDFITPGTGSIRPGLSLGLKWESGNLESPIDESMPSASLVGTVAHYYAPQRYYCRVKGIR